MSDTAAKIRCDACSVLCNIKPGRIGACGRHGNEAGKLVRTDPVVMTRRVLDGQGEVVPFLESSNEWDGNLITPADTFMTGIGSGAIYPDYKPAPFIASNQVEGVDMVTVVPVLAAMPGALTRATGGAALGGHMAAIRPLESVVESGERLSWTPQRPDNPWPLRPHSPADLNAGQD